MSTSTTDNSLSEELPPGGATALSETPADLTIGEKEVIAIFVQMVQVLGLPKSLGEIYGLLYASPRPLTFQDFVDRLNLSKGSVSQGLRFLRNITAVKPVVIPGDRREYFEPVVELRQLVSGLLRERLNPQLDIWRERARNLNPDQFSREGHSATDVRTIASRIDKLSTWHKRARTILPMVGKILG